MRNNLFPASSVTIGFKFLALLDESHVLVHGMELVVLNRLANVAHIFQSQPFASPMPVPLGRPHLIPNLRNIEQESVDTSIESWIQNRGTIDIIF